METEKKALSLHASYVDEVNKFMQEMFEKKISNLLFCIPGLIQEISNNCVNRETYDIVSEDPNDRILTRPANSLDKSLLLKKEIVKYNTYEGVFIKDEYYRKGVSYLILRKESNILICRHEGSLINNSVDLVEFEGDNCVRNNIEHTEETLRILCIIVDAFFDFKIRTI